jgi:flagellar biogenesis protein FliO
VNLWLRAARAIVLTLAVMLVAAEAKADPPDAGAPPWLAQNPPTQSAAAAGLPMGRMIVLLLVTAGLGGGAWYVRKRKLSKVGSSLHKKLRLIDSTRIGPKAELVIASVQGRTMLLGVTETNIRRLAWIDDEAPAEAAQPAAQPAGQPDSFTAMLRSLVDTEASDRNEDADDTATADTILRMPSAPVDRVTLRQVAPAQVSDSVEGQAAGLSRRSRRRA